MPLRTCVGCRKPDEQANLVRLVRDAQGRVKVDRKRRLAGRGAYVHVNESCVEQMVHEGGLPRSFRHNLQPVEASKLLRELEGFEEEGT